jgi:hypothetical protein
MRLRKNSHPIAASRAAAAPRRTAPARTWRRVRHAVAAVAAVASGILAAGTGFPAVTSAATHVPAHHKTASTTYASGLPWASGEWLINDSPSLAASFGSWRGRPVDVVDEWSARSTWQDIVNPSWLYKTWAGSPYTMSFGVAMLPSNVSGVSLDACAAGSYNSYWKQFGTNISSYGLGNSIIRLGWEFNGNWYPWAATQPTTWAQCWRQIVTSARSTAPGLVWNWNVNRGVSSGLSDPTQAYPGDAYVDMIGVDSYDWWPSATTDTGWQKQLNGTQGLNYWLSFAQAHGKMFSVPEWGNVSSSISSGAGGDDPAYVQDMASFFQANSASLAYECNFQGTSASTGGAYWPTTTLPNSAQAYRQSF